MALVVMYEVPSQGGQVGQPSPEPVNRTAPPVTTITTLATREASASRRMVSGERRIRAFTRTWYVPDRPPSDRVTARQRAAVPPSRAATSLITSTSPPHAAPARVVPGTVATS